MIQFDVSIKTSNGDKRIVAILKNPEELKECETNLVIILNLKKTTKPYTGMYMGMENNNIIIKSLTSNNELGIDLSDITCYLEEIKNPQ